MLVEHARNLLGLIDATHTEYGTSGSAIVNLLSCSLKATEITVDIAPGTRLAEIHGHGPRTELTNCNYGLNPDFQHIASEQGLVISAIDDTGEVRAIERPDHRFFVGTLYQPQRLPSEKLPHPLFDSFVRAVVSHEQGAAGQN